MSTGTITISAQTVILSDGSKLAIGAGSLHVDATGFVVGPPAVYIDPSAHTNGSGTQSNPRNTWAGISWVTGKTYLQKMGTTYSGTIVVSGTNVHLGSYGSGANPIATGIEFSGSHGCSVTGFVFTGTAPSNGGIQFDGGATNNTATSCDSHDNFLGVYFPNGGGTGNVVSKCNIYNSTADGVDIEDAVTLATVTECTIYNNGVHGVECQGFGNTIQYCYLYGNGATTAGCSGLHTYSSGSGVDWGHNNFFLYNVSNSTSNQGTLDGNGIEIDQWTHGNTVTGNLFYNNAGAGIIDLDAYSNVYSNNVCYSNLTGGLDTQEFEFLGSTGTGGPHNTGYTVDNTITGNIIYSVPSGTTNIYFDGNSASSKQTNYNAADNYSGGPHGNLTTPQLSTATAAWWAWWQGEGVPAWLQAIAKPILENMVSF